MNTTSDFWTPSWSARMKSTVFAFTHDAMTDNQIVNDVPINQRELWKRKSIIATFFSISLSKKKHITDIFALNLILLTLFEGERRFPCVKPPPFYVSQVSIYNGKFKIECDKFTAFDWLNLSIFLHLLGVLWSKCKENSNRNFVLFILEHSESRCYRNHFFKLYRH